MLVDNCTLELPTEWDTLAHDILVACSHAVHKTAKSFIGYRDLLQLWGVVFVDDDKELEEER